MDQSSPNLVYKCTNAFILILTTFWSPADMSRGMARRGMAWRKKHKNKPKMYVFIFHLSIDSHQTWYIDAVC
jgi:hypothetical protein